MKHIKIYLAGKMGGLSLCEMNSWREEIKEKLLLVADDLKYDITVINPCEFYNFEEIRYQSEKEVEDYDLAHVITSNVVVVNLDGLSSSVGTQIEIHEANRNYKIPIIAFGESEIYNNLHPWIQSKITRIENDIDDVVEYIKHFYMI